MTDLVIVIVSYNTRAALERCLRSLREHAPRCTHQVIVVDNASGDGSPAMVREDWPGVRLIETGQNLGFARANNLAVRQSASDLVLFLNSDTRVTAEALDRLVADLRQHPEVAVVGPRLVDPTGRVEISFGRMIGPAHELAQKLLGSLHRRGFSPARSYVERMTQRPRVVDWVSGACLLVRRADAEAAGLFDERFFLYAEDVDLCVAVRALGRQVRFGPVAEIVHERGQSGATAPEATRWAYRSSQLAFYAKHNPRWLPWLRVYLRLRRALPPLDSDAQSRWSAPAR